MKAGRKPTKPKTIPVNFVYTNISKRVIKLYDYLIEHGIIENQTEFCRRIKYKIQSLEGIMAERRNFPPGKVHYLCSEFRVSADFIFNGYGDMFDITAPIRQLKVKNVFIIHNHNKMIIRYTYNNKRNILELQL